MTTPLEALKAALEAKQEAWAALISFEDTAEFREAQRTWAECPKHDALRDAYLSKRTAFYALADADTIAALIAHASADDPEPPYDDTYTWGGDIYECWRRRQELRAPLFPKEIPMTEDKYDFTHDQLMGFATGNYLPHPMDAKDALSSRLAAYALAANTRADDAENECDTAIANMDIQMTRAEDAEAALEAERRVSATYARVGDAMKARGEARIKELEEALLDERKVVKYLLRTTRDERGHYLTTDGMKKHEAAAREAVKP